MELTEPFLSIISILILGIVVEFGYILKLILECRNGITFKKGVREGRKTLYDYYFKGFKNPVIVEKEKVEKEK